ncbi:MULTISPECIES: helix-turn-helix domain-containing protein [Neobacillus]|uniref:helix-turn-helix domain-containing protein n=1 Tax=Neobacillus TaxID=2675232 RepID=UPI001F462AD9|nr:helix-turn-helix domain-containing protein [Neobacillus drentensis]ULT54907.1 helix-turn-helix domain-containing protein [Neobacillus drentensis]
MKLEMKKDVIYRCIGTNFTNGILACGYMTKPSKEQSQFSFLIDYYSCFILLSGNGFYHLSNGKKIPIQAGDFVQRIPGVLHSTEVIPDGNWLEFFISFGRSTYDYLYSMNLLPTDTPVRKVEYDDNSIYRFNRMLKLLKDADDSELPYLSLKAQELVLSTINPITQTPIISAQEKLMEEACLLLSTDIDTNISLEKVAATLNMSYENFRKQFRKYIGIAPAQYRIEQKMKHAKLMLLSGISIKETSQLTGYSDTYSFTKQFSNTVGISPGRFKRDRR